MSMSGKEKCGRCSEVATWLYMPSGMESRPFFCDSCVPRGCECNTYHMDPSSYFPPLDSPHLPDKEEIEGIHWKWIEKDVSWCYIDGERREFPCCEFTYDEDGFDLE